MAQEKKSSENVPILREGRERRRGGPLAREGALSPFGFLGRMMEDMDRLFGGIGAGALGPFESLERPSLQAWSPEVEIFERDGSLVVRADLPGIDAKDVRVDIEDDALVVEGERRAEHEEKREGYFHSERSYGSFQRRIPLPRGADPSRVDARFDNGVLEVTVGLPKAASRKIEVRSGKPIEPPQVTPSRPVQNAPQRPH